MLSEIVTKQQLENVGAHLVAGSYFVIKDRQKWIKPGWYYPVENMPRSYAQKVE